MTTDAVLQPFGHRDHQPVPPGSDTPASRVQFKRSLAGLSYDEQMALVSPSPETGAVQTKSDDNVQMLRGNDAAVRSDVSDSGGTVGDEMNEKVRQGTHDENWNNKWKVEFENKLAALILGAGAGLTGPPVDLVSQRMLAYLERKARVKKKEAFEDALKADLEKMAVNMGRLGDNANTIFYGRLSDTLAPEELVGAVKDVLQGAGTLPQKLFTHHQFLDHIWDGNGEGDYFQLQKGKLLSQAQRTFTDLGFKLQELGPKELRDAPEVKEWFENRGRFDAKHDKKAKEAAGDGPAPRPESRAGAVFGNPHGTSTEAPSGISARAGEGGEVHATDAEFQAFKAEGSQIHSRGIDRLTMDEANKFIQEARLVFDMPLAGSVSGTTVDLMTIASVFDLSVDEKKLYAIAVLGHLESAGAHSFHEIALAASAVPGVSYTPGEYRSFLPPAIQALASDLLNEYGV